MLPGHPHGTPPDAPPTNLKPWRVLEWRDYPRGYGHWTAVYRRETRKKRWRRGPPSFFQPRAPLPPWRVVVVEDAIARLDGPARGRRGRASGAAAGRRAWQGNVGVVRRAGPAALRRRLSLRSHHPVLLLPVRHLSSAWSAALRCRLLAAGFGAAAGRAVGPAATVAVVFVELGRLVAVGLAVGPSNRRGESLDVFGVQLRPFELARSWRPFGLAAVVEHVCRDHLPPCGVELLLCAHQGADLCWGVSARPSRARRERVACADDFSQKKGGVGLPPCPSRPSSSPLGACVSSVGRQPCNSPWSSR